jgi:uncharacterized protein YjbJ (UPF0337 family)
MNKEQSEGKLDELKGRVKEGVGAVTDDPNTQNSGTADRVKGNLKQTFGDVKESLTGDDKDK